MPNPIANLFNITSTALKTFQSADGESIVATGGASANKGETAEIYSSPGIVSRPGANTKGIRLRFGKIDIILAVYNYRVTPPDNPGDTKLYGTDADGVEQSAVKALADGTVEVNGNADNAVSWTDLNTAIGQMATDINTELGKIATAINAIVPGSYTPTPIVPDLSGAKVNTVKLP